MSTAYSFGNLALDQWEQIDNCLDIVVSFLFEINNTPESLYELHQKSEIRFLYLLLIEIAGGIIMYGNFSEVFSLLRLF